jgi:hypothetical protein
MYPLLKAPTHCGVWGRGFLGSLSIAYYSARRLIQIQDLQDISEDTLPLRQARLSSFIVADMI